MPSPLSPLSPYQTDATSSLSPALPFAFFLASVLAYIGTSDKHALLTSAVAWLTIFLLVTVKAGARSLFENGLQQRLAWTVGALLALAQVCERAVDGRNIWWAKVLLPTLLHTCVKGGLFDEFPSTQNESSPSSPTGKRGPPSPATEARSTPIVLTVSALIATYAHSGSISVIALGLSHAVLTVLAFYLVEHAQKAAQRPLQNGGSVIYSASGLLTQPTQSPLSREEQHMLLLRDISAAGAVATGLAALGLERMSLGGLAYYGLLGKAMGDHWVFGQGILSVVFAAGTVLMHVVMIGALVLMIQSRGAFLTSFVPLAAALTSQLLVAFSLSRLWFAAICACAAFSFLDEQAAFTSGTRMKLRVSKILTATTLVSLVVLAVWYLEHPAAPANSTPLDTQPADAFTATPPAQSFEPLQPVSNHVHPIHGLTQDAQAAWSTKLKSQSQSLGAAVTEYRRRYGIPPPPHFDKWYEFAKRKGVQLIDEYDSIHDSLVPFWALSPATIRGRAREAIGYGDNFLMGLLVRDGKAKHVEGGPEWLQQAAVGMMEQFLEYLPDMDLAFNIHDEPRVVVPHDELARMVDIALRKNIPAAAAASTPKNSFSPRPKDLTMGLHLPESKTTRFNVFAHQPVWIPSRLSCSPDSPARAFDDSTARDNLTTYALGDLGFIYNLTAFSDICNSPSLAQSHGFFERPNAFNVVHDLFPVFSQSKMSSFQDILFPSPWYWYGKVEYKEGKDMDWAKKESRLWWRGSTTGGFSRDGGWKRQHRQRFVRKVSGLGQALVLSNSRAGITDEDRGNSKWLVKEAQRQDFKALMDVHFSHVGQCDPGDCDAMREYFTIVDTADQQDAWQYKYLLDMDGNAFSGRFYAFLKSHSLTFKMAVFREWHQDWIMPWVHYIPLSLRAEEALEAVRYLDAEDEGQATAVAIAESGRDWALKALRNEDLEVWLFRLMLEYGRVIDDNRASIGYVGA